MLYETVSSLKKKKKTCANQQVELAQLAAGGVNVNERNIQKEIG